MAEEDVEVRFGASLEGLQEGVKQALETIDGLKERIDSVTETVTNLGAALQTAFVGREIFEFIDSMAEIGERTERLANIFGITAEQVGFLDFAARETGTDTEGMTRSLERLSLQLSEAGTKATPAAAALKQLGLNAGDLAKLPLPELLDQLREKFSTLEPGMQRTALAQALIRNGAETLLPILSLSNERWEELRKSFEATGASMTNSMASAFAETKEKITTFETAVTALGERIFALLKPAIDAALDSMTKFVESIDAPHIATALGSVADVIINFMEDVTKFAAVAEAAIEEIMIRIDMWNKYRLQMFDDEHRAELAADLNAMHDSIDKTLDNLLATFEVWRDKAHAILDSAIDPVVGDRADELRAAMSGGTGVLPTVPSASTGTNAIKTQFQDLGKAIQKIGQDTERTWTQAMGAIVSSVNSQIMGLIKGTTTWGQALSNILLSFAQQGIEWVEKLAIQWIAKQVGMTAVTQAETAARTAAEQSGTAASTATRIAAAMAAIQSDAAATFAGIMANLAPVMGPAAVGPAAAGQATVLAQMASLDVGTWGLPADMPIMAHQGETIIPRFESGQFRDAIAKLAGGQAGGGAGGEVHFHVHAIDAAGVADFLRTHGGNIAKTVSGQFNANRSLRPAY